MRTSAREWVECALNIFKGIIIHIPLFLPFIKNFAAECLFYFIFAVMSFSETSDVHFDRS